MTGNMQKQEEKIEKRYDRELFKKALKAAKQAKEEERKRKARKKIQNTVIYVLGSILVCILVYFLLTLIKPKEEYLLSNQIQIENAFKEIQGENISSEIGRELMIPEISSLSAIAFNPLNGEVLYEKNINEKLSIASLTKLMSAIITLETFSLDEVVSVSRENIPKDLDWQLGLEEGDKVSIENLLKAMLISSYNDCAYIVANAYPYGGYVGFVKAMNRKAKELNMDSSRFSNPAGIDQEDNFSTVKDLALLVSVSRKYPEILKMANISKEIINWSTQQGVQSKEILTTNQLLGSNRYMKGLKTGITDLAGQCFTGYFVYPSGNELLTIVINSRDRFKETVLIESLARPLLR